MSVIHTTAEIGGTAYDYAYSDAGRWLVRDGALYAEAYDPPGSNRAYAEGDPMPSDAVEQAASDVLAILLGGAHD